MKNIYKKNFSTPPCVLLLLIIADCGCQRIKLRPGLTAGCCPPTSLLSEDQIEDNGPAEYYQLYQRPS